MDPATLGIVLALIEAAMKYGVPAVASAIVALNKDEITLEDIEGLKITKEPNEFL